MTEFEDAPCGLCDSAGRCTFACETAESVSSPTAATMLGLAVRVLDELATPEGDVTRKGESARLNAACGRLRDELREFLTAMTNPSSEGRPGAASPVSEGEEWTGWLIEETWISPLGGGTLYIHRDFRVEKWREECDRVRDIHRRRQPFCTKDANEAMRFKTEAEASAWMALQPRYIRDDGQYQVREHAALSSPPDDGGWRGPGREEVARVIDPGAFEANIQKRAAPHWREHAYRKADAILAMFSRPASPVVEEKP